MQQLLNPTIYWLNPLNQQPSCPSGCHLTSATAFQLQQGFSPAAFGDYMALTGRKTPGGVPGLSDNMARTLLKR